MYRTVGCGYWVVPLHLTLILRSAIFTLVLSSGMGRGGGEWEEDVEDDVVGNGTLNPACARRPTSAQATPCKRSPPCIAHLHC